MHKKNLALIIPLQIGNDPATCIGKTNMRSYNAVFSTDTLKGAFLARENTESFPLAQNMLSCMCIPYTRSQQYLFDPVAEEVMLCYSPSSRKS